MRLLSLKMMILLALLGLLGCPRSEPKEIVFWKFADTLADPTLQKYVTLWNQQNPESPVHFYTYPWGDYVGTKLTAAFISRSGPDVFWISAGDFLKLVNNEIAYPLDDYFSPAIKDDFLPAALRSVTVEGHLYAVPFEMEPLALFYDKQLFAAEGLVEPKTWTELIGLAKRLKTKNRDGLVIETAPGYYQNFSWYPFLWQQGGEVLDAGRRVSRLQSPAAIEAVRLWGDLLNRHAVSPKSLTGSASQIDILASGLTAMQECGYWGVKALDQGFPEFKYGVCPLPSPTGGAPVSIYGGWMQMVNAQSPRRAEAARFTMWMWAQSRELPLEWCTRVNTKFSPRKSILAAAKGFYDRWPNSVFRDAILPGSRPEPCYPPEVGRAVEDCLQEVMFSGTPPEQAVRKADDKINRFLKHYKGKL